MVKVVIFTVIFLSLCSPLYAAEGIGGDDFHQYQPVDWEEDIAMVKERDEKFRQMWEDMIEVLRKCDKLISRMEKYQKRVQLNLQKALKAQKNRDKGLLSSVLNSHF